MILSINKVSKTYKNGLKAINELSLELRHGMFGLLGPNGAGKSSLMRTIATLQAPDEGTIHFNGSNIFEHKTDFRKTLGYLPQDFGVYPSDSAEQLLNYFAVLKGISSKKDRTIAVQEVLEMTNLWEVRKKRVSTFSGGMRQRFGIAQLLLNRPKLIIVDEPTAGLDPAERARFLNVLRDIGSSNIVLFSTHLVDDVKELCSSMAIINKGSVLTKTAPKTAIADLKGKIWKKTIQKAALPDWETRLLVLSSHYDENNALAIKVFAEQKPAEGFQLCQANLEDYYFLTLNTQNHV